MNIVLYYSPIACSLVPYVTLTEAGAAFQVKPIALARGQQFSPEYLAINPKHKVPMLVVDGASLTENVAIQQWIARTFPAARLLPEDPWQFLQAVSVMAWCASGIHPYLSRINSPLKVCDVPGSEPNTKRLATEPLMEALGIADAMLAGREYFFDHFTAADAHFFWCLRRASQFGIDLTVLPNAHAHHQRLNQRDSIRKVLAFEKATTAELAGAA